MTKPYLFVALIACIALASCKPDPAQNLPDEDVQLGGATTYDGAFVNIFQQPAPNLNALELEQHRLADLAFGDIFVTAPAVNNAGLGPVFNQASCENCHVANGRSPFPASEDNLRGLLLRISIPGADAHGGPNPVPGFGGQLQNKAVFGKAPEAKVSWQFVQSVEQYLDGISVHLQKPVFNLSEPYTALPNDLMLSARMAPPVFGLGLLEAIKTQDINALADPNDSNGDGISGKTNRVWNTQTQQFEIGRFGWKAGQPNLLQQSAGAYNQDMGVTNPIFGVENCFDQPQHDGLTDDPDINEATLKAATFYTQSLAVPARRNWDNPAVQKGKTLFTSIQCNGCHQPKFVTGQHPEFAFLSNQTIYPYTDLLLHDMGEGLSDNRPEFDADGREWRTPPLWGIGLTLTVGGHSNFLHDGRARSLEEAILWHGGEAENSKNQYKKLSKSDREALLSFLQSL